jgi:hypothetical protein
VQLASAGVNFPAIYAGNPLSVHAVDAAKKIGAHCTPVAQRCKIVRKQRQTWKILVQAIQASAWGCRADLNKKGRCFPHQILFLRLRVQIYLDFVHIISMLYIIKLDTVDCFTEIYWPVTVDRHGHEPKFMLSGGHKTPEVGA